MTMLTQTGRSFEQSSRPSVDRHAGATHAVAVHRTIISEVCWFILKVLLAGGALAGIIALKTLAFVWRLHA